MCEKISVVMAADWQQEHETWEASHIDFFTQLAIRINNLTTSTNNFLHRLGHGAQSQIPSHKIDFYSLTTEESEARNLESNQPGVRKKRCDFIINHKRLQARQCSSPKVSVVATTVTS